MKTALLAVHPQVRDIVFAPGVLDEIAAAVELRDATSVFDTGTWPAHADAELVITGWGTPALGPDALASLPRLAAVFHVGGTVRGIVGEEVFARGAQVVTAADANNESVADFVHAQIVLALKGSYRSPQVMREQGKLPAFMAGPGTLRQTVGLLSFGSIARKVRQHLARLHADVLVFDPHVDDADLAAAGVRRAATLEELFDAAAVVSVHTPLIPGVTEGMITAELLARLRPGAVFLNTARGQVVDEPALTALLAERPDVTAILDVTWAEPPPADSVLYDLPNVVLTGHTAGSVGTENQRMGDLIRDEVLAFAKDEDLTHAITVEQSRLRA